ncbi:MAG: hypothetical protein IH969_03250 [Candidatus Krumholzibacteriota bacterium]|nr:hypothetical protein [Candidatus Krumholzibacteriota bacterium]
MGFLRWMGLSALLVLTLTGAARSDEYFQQFVHYTINAHLDASEKMLTGTETIVYTNNSPDTIPEFYLHLYPNAYRNRHTAFMKHYRQRFNLNLFDLPGKHRGYLDITDVRVDGKPASVEVDDTIARFALPAPLKPGETVTIELAFESKIRQRIGRAGYEGDHYDMAQWYPKVVVYDENGFHPNKFEAGEFYGEFGTYDVILEIPDNFVVAATGSVVSGDPGWDYNPVGRPGKRKASGHRQIHFHAENVHDFAWSADPTFVVEDTTVAGIDIRSIYRHDSRKTWADSTLAHGIRAIEWLTERVGPYPYPQVTIVEALFKGGMEYPMLVMDGRADESLVVHEIGHIYFYGILANDENAEAWLDEGFTTFQTRWFNEQKYGPDGNPARRNWYERITPQPDLWEEYRGKVFALQRRGYGERVAQPAENFDHSYYTHVYYKAALILNAIRYAAGEEVFQKILHEYYAQWQLKHVNEERFRSVVESVVEVDLKDQFDQWLHTPKICDYELSEVRTRETSDGVQTSVVIKRLGELFLPIEVHFELEDGTVSKHRIDGKLRTIRQSFLLPSKPKRTAINPDNEIMDVDLTNNFSPRRTNFQIDWPNNHYYPEDGYTIRHRPGAWYNDVDGLKAGYHLSGSFHNLRRRIKFGLYYGALSERLDFSASYEKPIKFLGRKGEMGLFGYKMEGRQDFHFQIHLKQRRTLIKPPVQEFIIGYGYHELTDARYLTSPEIYDTNMADVGVYFAYRADPQVDLFATDLRTDLRFGRGWTGGDYHYERLSFDFRLYTREALFPLQLRMRTFIGVLGGTSTPTQQKFNLAGGGPLAQERRFWLRSPGAIWPELHYHEPGDGNLRGYYQGTFGVNKLVAFNAELGSKIPFWILTPVIKPLLGVVKWYGFYDAGKILDDANPIGSSARVQSLADGGILDASLQNAGIGFVSHRVWPFWDLRIRFDMPLWVSHPEVNGEVDETKFRYLFSISTSF